MELMKEICEDINDYEARLEVLVESIDAFLAARAKEKRLGITLEARDYYQNGNQQNNDTVDFEPQPNVQMPAKQPVQQQPKPAPVSNKSKVQLMYNPATGRVENAKEGPGTQPPAQGYVQPNEQQIQDALKHINANNKALADKIVSGEVSLWIPQNPQAVQKPSNVRMVGNVNQLKMDPGTLDQAKQAANKMSLA